MDKKKREFIAILLIVISLSGANIVLYFSKVKSNMSGFAITDITKMPENISFSLGAFLVQWLLVVLILIVGLIRYARRAKDEKIDIAYKSIKEKLRRGTTDIDLLYSLLQDKKRLKINVISKTFRINKAKALEWARILENHDLATINYPTFSEPEVGLRTE